MKKAFIIFAAFAFVLMMAAPVLSADLPRGVDKIVNGTIDVVKSPLVIYDHTKAEFDGADNKAYGLVKGLIISPFHLIEKAGGGLLEIVTFPID